MPFCRSVFAVILVHVNAEDHRSWAEDGGKASEKSYGRISGIFDSFSVVRALPFVVLRRLKKVLSGRINEAQHIK